MTEESENVKITCSKCKFDYDSEYFETIDKKTHTKKLHEMCMNCRDYISLYKKLVNMPITGKELNKEMDGIILNIRALRCKQRNNIFRCGNIEGKEIYELAPTAQGLMNDNIKCEYRINRYKKLYKMLEERIKQITERETYGLKKCHRCYKEKTLTFFKLKKNGEYKKVCIECLEKTKITKEPKHSSDEDSETVQYDRFELMTIKELNDFMNDNKTNITIQKFEDCDAFYYKKEKICIISTIEMKIRFAKNKEGMEDLRKIRDEIIKNNVKVDEVKCDIVKCGRCTKEYPASEMKKFKYCQKCREYKRKNEQLRRNKIK